MSSSLCPQKLSLSRHSIAQNVLYVPRSTAPTHANVANVHGSPFARPRHHIGHTTHNGCQLKRRVVGPTYVAAAVGTLDWLPRWPAKAPDFLSTKHDKDIRDIALPALCSMLLEPIMGAINAALIGHLGTQQLGAVSLGSLCISFGTFLFSFLLFLTTPEIAAAVGQKDADKVSKIAGKGFWLAGVLGLFTAVATIVLAGPLIALMKPPEPAVATMALSYIQVRALGIFASLIGFVATGTYRGFKDTKTPLYAAAGSAFTSLALNLLFIYGFHMGIVGSGLATLLAQYVSCFGLCFLLVRSGRVKLADMVRPPSWRSTLPMLRAGAVLAFRNLVSFGMIMYASVLCVRAGSTYQASFEVVRQLWILTIQFFECLNVATQALCASFLGFKDTTSAREVMNRLLFLGTCIGAACGVSVHIFQLPFVAFFTADLAVRHEVLKTLSVVCVMFPLDAAASIMDGSLLAAKQTNYMSYVQIAGSVVQYAGLLYLADAGMVSALTIWTMLKLSTIFRLGGGYWRNFMSSKSGYLTPVPA